MNTQSAKEQILNAPLLRTTALEKFSSMLDDFRTITGNGKIFQQIAEKHHEHIENDPDADKEEKDCARFLSQHVGPHLVKLFEITPELEKEFPNLFPPLPPANPSNN